MPPQALVAIFDGAVAILERVIPAIGNALSKGDISVEIQAQLKKRVDDLRDVTAFSGPEWDITQD